MDRQPHAPLRWRLPGQTIDLTRRGLVMGILNVTFDSFSDGGLYSHPAAATRHGLEMLEAGADLIDVGGESTRPGAAAVPLEEELARVLPVVTALQKEVPGCLISVDTSKSVVARAALEAGAVIVNDVTGLSGDPEMAGVAAAHGAGVIIMHMQGTPRNMQKDPKYGDVVREVREFFARQFEFALAAGIDPEAVVFDPGIGFGKSLRHNFQLLRAVDEFAVHGRPIAIGVSRKSFIGRVLSSAEMEDRDWPTVALTSYLRERGARIHRVHDVRPNAEALRMTEAILEAPD